MSYNFLICGSTFVDKTFFAIMTSSKIVHSCTVGKNELCCFDQLSEEEIAFVESNMVELEFEKGETICKQGAFASHIIVSQYCCYIIRVEENMAAFTCSTCPSQSLRQR